MFKSVPLTTMVEEAVAVVERRAALVPGAPMLSLETQEFVQSECMSHEFEKALFN